MRRADYWLLGSFAALVAVAAALVQWLPPSSTSGMAIGLPWADLAFKLAFSAWFGLTVTRAYPWRRRAVMALPFGAVWFVMTAGAAHLPASLLGAAYVGAMLMVVGAFLLDWMWPRGQ